MSIVRTTILVAAAVCLIAPAVTAEDFLEAGDVISVLGEQAAPLDLDQCLELAITNNPTIRQELEGLAGLDARKTQARSEGLPRFELQGAWSRSRDPSFAFDETFGGGGDAAENPFQFFFDYVDPLYQDAGLTPPDLGLDGGFNFLPEASAIPAQTFWRTYIDGYWELRPTRVYRAVNAAEGAIDQQKARIRDAENRTQEEVIRGYHALVLAHERSLAIESELEAREEFLNITRRRFRLEFATALDTLQAAVSLANLQPEARRRQRDLRQAGQALNRLMGRDPLAPLAIVASFPLETETISLERALQLARHRPDLEAQRRQTDLYELQRGVAKATNHPYLTMEGQVGYVTRDLGELTDDGHDFWRAGVTLHVPLFDGLTARGQAKEAEASIRRNEVAVSALERDIRDEVIVALDDLEIARANLRAAQLNMQRADDAYHQISLRYELGKSSNLDVLNAQAERFTARTTLIEARYEVLASLATLKRAIGVSPSLPLATVLASTTTEENDR